jgi:luciferase family oxidoreductase group 1
MVANTGIDLSVVDQSPMRRDGTAAEALQDTIRLAQATERLGYKRFWVAEHHSSRSFVGTSPEILAGQILAVTSRMRVGSGGVLLSHYSPLKVAEQFRILDSIHPGRVDLGIGRAPGGSRHVAEALAMPGPVADPEAFPNQVSDLIGFLNESMESNHPYADVRVQPGPQSDTVPEVWLLGSSDVSAGLAAKLGLSFAFADFFGDIRERGPGIAKMYRDQFRPSSVLREPRLMVALQVLCAPSEDEAENLGASRNLNKAGGVIGGLPHGLLPPEEARDFPRSAESARWEAQFRMGYIDGTSTQVKQQMLEVTDLYEADEITIVTITYDIEHKIRSYELVAEAFGLGSLV